MSRIDETISKMQEFIKGIEDETLKHIEDLDEEGRLQAKTLADKTITTINSSIEKLVNMKETISNETDLEDFLNRLETKCKDVADFTVSKIDEIRPIVKEDIQDLKSDLEKDFDDFKKDLVNIKIAAKRAIGAEEKKQEKTTYDKLLDNEYVKNAIKFAKYTKDKAIEFYNDPKTQKAINEAKLETIHLAEKGLEKLKQILEDENKED